MQKRISFLVLPFAFALQMGVATAAPLTISAATAPQVTGDGSTSGTVSLWKNGKPQVNPT